MDSSTSSEWRDDTTQLGLLRSEFRWFSTDAHSGCPVFWLLKSYVAEIMYGLKKDWSIILKYCPLLFLLSGCDTGATFKEGDINLSLTSLGGPLGGLVLGAMATNNTIITLTNDGVFWTEAADPAWRAGIGTFTQTGAFSAYNAKLFDQDENRQVMIEHKNFHVSNDGGRTWEGHELSSPAYLSASGEENNIYLLVESGDILHTNDVGESWKTLHLDEELTRLFDEYKISAFAADNAGNLFIGTLESGVFRYDQTSSTWSQTGLNEGAILRMLVTAEGVLFASGFDGLHRSLDDGMTWELKTSARPNLQQIGVMEEGQDGALYIAEARGIHVSDDLGDSWRKIEWSSPIRGITSLSLENDGMLFVGTREGMWIIDPENGAATHRGVQLARNQLAFSYNDAIYSGTSAGMGSLYKMAGGNTPWKRLNLNGFIRSAAVTHTNDLIIGAVYQGIDSASGALFITSGNDDVWREADLTSPGAITSIISLPTGDVLAGTNLFDVYEHPTLRGGIHVSKDNLQSWKFIDMNASITSLAALENGVLLAAGAEVQGEGVMFHSLDSGNRWRKFSIDRTRPVVNAMAVDNRGHVYAATTKHGIYRSIDGGNVWMQVTPHLNDLFIGSIVADKNGNLFAGTAAGLLVSVDGFNWQFAEGELKGQHIFGLSIHQSGEILAATERSGIFIGSISE